MANKKEKILIFIPILILIIITIFISTSDKKVYIRKNSSYAAGSTTLNGYSIDSVTISSNNSNNIDLYYYPSDLSLGGGITYKSSCWGNANYNISGLDSSKVYKASVHIKTIDLTSSSSYGATLGTARSITGFSNIVFSWSESVIGTSEKDVDLFFGRDYNTLNRKKQWTHSRFCLKGNGTWLKGEAASWKNSRRTAGPAGPGGF